MQGSRATADCRTTVCPTVAAMAQRRSFPSAMGSRDGQGGVHCVNPPHESDYTPDMNTLGLWHFSGAETTEADDDTEETKQTASWGGTNISRTTNYQEKGVGFYVREYTYDKVGNRKTMRLVDVDGSVSRDITWNFDYNTMNQHTQRYNGTWSNWTAGEERFSYQYDDNGNLTQQKTETYSGGWTETLKWDYYWNPRDQLKRAVKYVNGSANNSGSVRYEYCLSCDGALSKRLQFGAGTGSDEGALQSGVRYEYDGLNLLRMDQLYDNDSNGLEENDAWRIVEVGTHRSGQLGALLGKRVYEHTNNDSTPDGYDDYTYGYDAVGNAVLVFDYSGNETFLFSQDAFGNELLVDSFAGSDWATARDTYGVNEHQTGKWVDPFTGQYYFHARWYDSVVGRFTGRDPLAIVQPSQGRTRAGCGGGSPGVQQNAYYLFEPTLQNQYAIANNDPTSWSDPHGDFPMVAWAYAFACLSAAFYFSDVANAGVSHFSGHFCQ